MVDKKRRELLNSFRKIGNIIDPIVLEPDKDDVKRTIYLMDKKAKEISTHEAMKKLEDLLRTHSLKRERLLIGLILPIANDDFFEEIKTTLASLCNKKVFIEDLHTDSITIAELIDNVKPEKLVIIRARKTIDKKQVRTIVKNIVLYKKDELSHEEFASSLMGTDEPEILVKSAIAISKHKPECIKLIDLIYVNKTMLLNQLKDHFEKEVEQ